MTLESMLNKFLTGVFVGAGVIAIAVVLHKFLGVGFCG